MILFHSPRPVTAGILLALSAIGAPAAGQAAGAAGAVSREARIAGRICREAVRIDPGTSQHDACVESLVSSMVSMGFQVREDELEAKLTRLVVPGGKRSYAAAPVDAIQLRYRLACDLAGFPVQSGNLPSCATALSAAMFNADNPQP